MRNTHCMQIVCVLLCAMFLCACAAPATPSGVPEQSDDHVLSHVRAQYRNASLIVEGVCAGNHMAGNGARCYDLTITDVLAGAAKIGDVVHCSSREMQEGESYLLFLSEGEDVHHSEDTPAYELLTQAPLSIKDDAIDWEGSKLPMDTLLQELKEMQDTINAPAPVYYYDTLASLVEAADEIFIGRVTEIGPMELRNYSIRNGGSVEKAQYNTAVVTVEAYGSITGVLRYGQSLEMVYSPQRVSGMLDAATLQPTNFLSGAVTGLEENGIYMFFLIDGPDSKQSCFFPINPVQGFVRINGSDIVSSILNAPLAPYNTLDPLVIALQQALKTGNNQQENPPLVIE